MTIRWDRESWRRLYRAEPLDQRARSLLWRGIRDYLVRMPEDVSGVLLPKTTDPVAELVQALGPHPSEMELAAQVVRDLMEDGYLEYDKASGCLRIRNYKRAQTAKSKSAERLARWRALHKRDENVTRNARVPTKNAGETVDETRRDETRSEEDHSSSSGTGPVVRRVFDAWVQARGKDPKRTKLTAQRRAKVQARLRDGYSEADLLAAVRGLALSPWHCGENPEGRVWDDLEIVCKSGAQVEKFRDLAGGSTTGPAQGSLALPDPNTVLPGTKMGGRECLAMADGSRQWAAP